MVHSLGVELWAKTDSPVRVYDSLDDIYENVHVLPDQFLVV